MVLIAARRVAYIKKQSAGSACKSTDRISCCRFAMAEISAMETTQSLSRLRRQLISTPGFFRKQGGLWFRLSPVLIPPKKANLARLPGQIWQTRQSVVFIIPSNHFAFLFLLLLFSFLAKRKRKGELSYLTSYTSQRWRSSRPNGLPCPPPA